jgi:predicted dehydrogenase
MGVVRIFREVMASGMFGKLRCARFGQGNLGGITTGSGFISDAAIAGGGPLLETGVHGIDAVHFCLGAQETKLRSGKIVMDGQIDVHAEAVYDIVDANGDTIPFEVEVSRLKNTINRVEFEFERATVHFVIFSLADSDKFFVSPSNSKLQYTLTDPKRNYPGTWSQIVADFWRDFFRGIETNTPNYTAAIRSILTTQAVQELYALANKTPSSSR